MRSAKPDKKANLNILKYAVDPNTGEVFADEEEKTKILLKDYEGNYVLPAYPIGIGCDVHELFIEISVMVRQCRMRRPSVVDAEWSGRPAELNGRSFAGITVPLC
jgi:hypothetical protein